MTLYPHFSIGIINIWWFALLYMIMNFIIMYKSSKRVKDKVLFIPKKEQKKTINISVIIPLIFGKILVVYSIFITIPAFELSFYIGLFIYFIGLVLSLNALYTFSKQNIDEPVTKGIYRISRHPMQVMSFIMWFGIGIISGSWIGCILAIVYAAISYKSLISQENYCIDKYGNKYIEYMKETPRYLVF